MRGVGGQTTSIVHVVQRRFSDQPVGRAGGLQAMTGSRGAARRWRNAPPRSPAHRPSRDANSQAACQIFVAQLRCFADIFCPAEYWEGHSVIPTSHKSVGPQKPVLGPPKLELQLNGDSHDQPKNSRCHLRIRRPHLRSCHGAGQWCRRRSRQWRQFRSRHRCQVRQLDGNESHAFFRDPVGHEFVHGRCS